MTQFKTPQSFDKSSSLDFYEERYRQGYMSYWPDVKQKRVFNIIEELRLPETGDALDFGCGNGIFTEVLRKALNAGWQVYGVDISTTAINNARSMYPNCHFFGSDDEAFKDKKFDFVFTHHVLEHVLDINEVIMEIESHLKERSYMLHILPCANQGSFEANVCSLRTDGINPNIGNRFFFEDEGHIRRLTTQDLVELVKQGGFSLEMDFYSCQYYGAIDWITTSGRDFVSGFTDQKFGVNETSRQKLNQLRRLLLPLTVLREFARRSETVVRSKPRGFRSILKIFFYLFLFPFTKPFDLVLTWLSENEWNNKKLLKNGSEMYLFFKRAAFPVE